MPERKLSQLIYVLILIGYCVYAALYIWKTSFVIDGERYFCLFDDEMISMRYAKNLAEGRGLVWNPGGERVEGFTNPLWTLSMSLFHLLPIPASKMSLPIQVTGAVFLLLNLLVVRRMALVAGNGSDFVSVSAVLLTAFHVSLLTWGLQGTETSVLLVAMSYATWKGLESLRDRHFTPLIYLILGGATFVRIDMAVPFVGIGVFLALADRQNRVRHLKWGSTVLVISLLIQTLFRVAYYGEILPNTYYLKVAGFPALFRMARGFHVFGLFAGKMNSLIFILPLLLLLFRRDTQIGLLLWCFAVQVLYSIYVGGDAWETFGGSNRYISVAMPLFFVLVCCGLEEIRSGMLRKARGRLRPLQALSKPVFVLIVLAILMRINRINDSGALEEWRLAKRPALMSGNRANVEKALIVDELTTPNAKVAVVQAGATGYFSERHMVDLLGKSDKVVARGSGHVPSGIGKYIGFCPGHQKWDYDYSLGELKPDVVVQLWGNPSQARPYLSESYTNAKIAAFRLFLRKNSSNIRWERVETLAGDAEDSAKRPPKMGFERVGLLPEFRVSHLSDLGFEGVDDIDTGPDVPLLVGSQDPVPGLLSRPGNRCHALPEK